MSYHDYSVYAVRVEKKHRERFFGIPLGYSMEWNTARGQQAARFTFDVCDHSERRLVRYWEGVYSMCPLCGNNALVKVEEPVMSWEEYGAYAKQLVDKWRAEEKKTPLWISSAMDSSWRHNWRRGFVIVKAPMGCENYIECVCSVKRLVRRDDGVYSCCPYCAVHTLLLIEK
ncbi:MAG: hypothetical protein MPK05_07465 [Gammaproteobacteria bacterium]|nr:hypothetical protein [Gammaproteobacteria bacterium]